MVMIQPDQAEEAMLRNIICDLLADADRQGEAECRFQRFQIQIRRLSRRRHHLTVTSDKEPIIEADIDVS